MSHARTLSLVTVVVVLLLGAQGWAGIIDLTPEYTLQQVMDEFTSGFRVGDKVFSDWIFTDTSQNGGLAPTPEGIKVQGVYFDLDGNNQLDPTIDEIGLRFSGGWSAFADQIVDTIIGFKVMAADPFLISDNTLKMTAFGSAGTGQASISENVYADAGLSELIASKYVFDNALLTRHEDHVEYGRGYKEVWVIKDITANGGGEGAAHISQFYNTFSQVPEPATLILLGLGGMGVLLRRRRRARA